MGSHRDPSLPEVEVQARCWWLEPSSGAHTLPFIAVVGDLWQVTKPLWACFLNINTNCPYHIGLLGVVLHELVQSRAWHRGPARGKSQRTAAVRAVNP